MNYDLDYDDYEVAQGYMLCDYADLLEEYKPVFNEDEIDWHE